MTDVDAVVVGAGVTGLTTAISLAEAGLRTRVVTAEPPSATTSVSAGAIWGPVRCGPAERCYPWARTGLDVLSALAGEPGTGVHAVSGREVCSTVTSPPPWTDMLAELRVLGRGELPDRFVSGWQYTAPAVNMPVYLEYLLRRYQSVGGTVAAQTVTSLGSVAAPVVVNCTGIGARSLVPDNALVPVRGQVVVVENPGIGEFYLDHGDGGPEYVYLFPHGDVAVLGGTAHEGADDLAPRAEVAARILRDITAVFPSLRGARVVAERVGLRPVRPQVRLEAEALPGGRALWHNYGHGGAGVTLSWGCAAELTAAVLAGSIQALSSNARDAAHMAIWETLKRLSDRTPLRTKLITALLALVIMALAAISITSVVVLRSYLTNQRDSTLTPVFAQISQSVDSSFDPGHPPGYAYHVGGAQGVYAGLEQPGLPLTMPSLGSGGLGSGPQGPVLPGVPTSQAWANANNGKLLTIGARSGPDSWRVIAGPVNYGGQVYTLVVAYDLGPISGEIQRLTTVELTVGTVIVVVLAMAGIAVVRANLRPLNDIEMTAGEIAKGHLDHRIPERDPRTEIGSLGRSLNTMLSQIETAFRAQHESERAAHESERAAHESERAAHESEERMRRFIADASHELRTPLTTIRGFAEYYRQLGGVRKGKSPPSAAIGGAAEPASGSSTGGLSPEDLDRIMRRLESEASRMGLLVEDLLQLARIDQQRPLDMAPVDMLSLAADAVQDARIVAPGRPIDLAVAPGAAFLVEGDEPRLRQVIGNLVNNALTHTPPGTPVRVKIAAGTLIPPHGSAGGRDGSPSAGVPVPAVVLDVADDGPGMTAEQAQRVFERFYRADQARNRATGGTGLGLAIVQGLVTAHGGTVAVSTEPGRGADFQVKLPLSPDAQAGEFDDDDPTPSTG